VAVLALPSFVSGSLVTEAVSCESIPRSDAGGALLQLSGDRDTVLQRLPQSGHEEAQVAEAEAGSMSTAAASAAVAFWAETPALLQVAEKRAQPKVCALQQDHCFDLNLTASPDEVEDDPLLMDAPSSDTAPPELVLVVARYHEDTQWLDALQDVPTILYNRGGSDTLLPQKRSNLIIVKQENTGREDEVMLRHIVDNYDNLPEITVFLQGWPFLHCPGALHTVARLAKEGGGLLPISRSFYQYSMEEGLVGAELSMARSPNLENKSLERWHALLQYKKICELVMGGKECPARQWVAEGAQWAVSRERIRSQPLELYKRALNLEEGFHSKLRGLVLEALWPVLWNGGSWSPSEMGVRINGNNEALLDLQGFSQKSSGTTPSTAYTLMSKRGSSVRSKVWTDGKHCAVSSKAKTEHRKGPLFSCEARMGFCELEWRLSGMSYPASTQYLSERSRFVIEGMPNSAAEPWSMHVRIGAPLLSGRAAYLEVQDPEQEVWLRQREGNVSTTWKVMDWDSSNASSHIFVIAHATDFASPWRYLGCSSESGQATLGLAKVGWRLMRRAAGRVSLVANDGRLLRLKRGNPRNMRLACMPADFSPNSDVDIEKLETIFSLDLLERRGVL